MDVLLGAHDRPLTDDEITDLIEKIVEDLDLMSVEPSVGTERVGEDVAMTIGVLVFDELFEVKAMAKGAATIATTLEKVLGVPALNFVSATNAHARARQLEPA